MGTGNPRGRPRGARNKATVKAEKEAYRMVYDQAYAQAYADIMKENTITPKKKVSDMADIKKSGIKLNGHSGTFRVVKRRGDYTMLESEQYGSKAYNIILKKKKIYAEGVDGMKDPRAYVMKSDKPLGDASKLDKSTPEVKAYIMGMKQAFKTAKLIKASIVKIPFEVEYFEVDGLSYSLDELYDLLYDKITTDDIADYIDDLYEPFRFGNLEYSPSQTLRAVDPVAYDEVKADIIDSAVEDIRDWANTADSGAEMQIFSSGTTVRYVNDQYADKAKKSKVKKSMSEVYEALSLIEDGFFSTENELDRLEARVDNAREDDIIGDPHAERCRGAIEKAREAIAGLRGYYERNVVDEFAMLENYDWDFPVEPFDETEKAHKSRMSKGFSINGNAIHPDDEESVRNAIGNYVKGNKEGIEAYFGKPIDLDDLDNKADRVISEIMREVDYHMNQGEELSYEEFGMTFTPDIPDEETEKACSGKDRKARKSKTRKADTEAIPPMNPDENVGPKSKISAKTDSRIHTMNGFPAKTDAPAEDRKRNMSELKGADEVNDIEAEIEKLKAEKATKVSPAFPIGVVSIGQGKVNPDAMVQDAQGKKVVLQ